MPTFMMSMNFTDQGIRGIKDAPKRAEAARDLAKKLGVEVKHLYLIWRERSGGFRRNAEWRQRRKIRAGAWLARQRSHPYLPRLVGRGIREARLRAALE